MKEEARTDEQLEALLSQYNIAEPQGLNCRGSNKVTRMCVNHNCDKPSLMCNGDDCQFCENAHLMCLNIKIKAITLILIKRAGRQKDFLGQINKIENKFLDELFRSNANLASKYHLGGLEDKYLSTVSEIYNKSNSQCLVGKDAKDFFERLTNSKEPATEQINALLEDFNMRMETLFESMVDMKNKVYESFIKVCELQREEIFTFDSQIINRPFNANIEEMKPYDSFIVKHSKTLLDELISEQMKFIKQSLGNPKSLELLFRASENEFSLTKFHEKCDNILNTFTLVRTEYGKTIGGFTQYPWSNPEVRLDIKDVGNQSFLLSVDLKQKMTPIGLNTIYCQNIRGPAFGGQGRGDLFITDKCNINKDSATFFPSHYNLKGAPYKKIQDSYRAISGAIQSYCFRVMEYEVFRVHYN